MEKLITPLSLNELPAPAGAGFHASGDVPLLEGEASLDNYAGPKPFAKMLSTAGRMVILPAGRVLSGALPGVYAGTTRIPWNG